MNSATPPNNKKGPCVNNQLGDSIIQGDFSGGKTDIGFQAMVQFRLKFPQSFLITVRLI